MKISSLLLLVVFVGFTPNAFPAGGCDFDKANQVLLELDLAGSLAEFALKDPSPDSTTTKMIQAAYMSGDFALFERFVTQKIYAKVETYEQAVAAAKLLMALRKTPNLSKEFAARYDRFLSEAKLEEHGRIQVEREYAENLKKAKEKAEEDKRWLDAFVENPTSSWNRYKAASVFYNQVWANGEKVDLSEVRPGDYVMVRDGNNLPVIGKVANVFYKVSSWDHRDRPEVKDKARRDLHTDVVFIHDSYFSVKGDWASLEFSLGYTRNTVVVRGEHTAIRLADEQAEYLANFHPDPAKREKFFRSASRKEREALLAFKNNPEMASEMKAATEPFISQIERDAKRVKAAELKKGDLIMVNRHIGQVKRMRSTADIPWYQHSLVENNIKEVPRHLIEFEVEGGAQAYRIVGTSTLEIVKADFKDDSTVVESDQPRILKLNAEQTEYLKLYRPGVFKHEAPKTEKEETDKLFEEAIQGGELGDIMEQIYFKDTAKKTLTELKENNPYVYEKRQKAVESYLGWINSGAKRVNLSDVKAGDYVFVNGYFGKVKRMRSTKDLGWHQQAPGVMVVFEYNTVFQVTGTESKNIVKAHFNNNTTIVREGETEIGRLDGEQVEFLNVFN